MSSHLTATLLDDDAQLTLAELARACRAAEEQVQVWVVEGVLQPSGNSPPEWRFAGASLKRARLAVTLTRELEINAPGVALALDLMDEIEALKSSLRRSLAA
ncbi:MAG: chaperone modulator CbpM [Burkholderiales bacterium]